MPHGQLYINNKDAYDTWGMSFDQTSLSALLTPPGMKANVTTKSRISHGERVSRSLPRMDARKMSLVVQFCAKDENQFFSRYLSFCNELKTGFLNIKTSFQPDVVYRCEYNDCSQFTQFCRGYAKFTLKLTENDPSNRSL